MCGIMGCIADNAAAKVISGLKKLEYRGYDSWGIAVYSSGSFKLFKHIGKIGEFDAISSLPKSKLSIGHTRWATHGQVTEANAHPHFGCDSKIVSVHNGIIENYSEIKKVLMGKGHVFISETDSEVVPHLVEEHMKKLGFNDACISAAKELKGSYALLISDGIKMFAAKNESPLAIGKGETGIYVASDASAFAEYASEAIFLEDGDFAVISDTAKIFQMGTGKEIERKPERIEPGNMFTGKEGFRHYMLKEIFDQPKTAELTAKDFDGIKEAASLIKNSDKIVMTACGTAYHAALFASKIMAIVANKKADVILASEFSSQENFIDRSTIVIAVSQSGETADVLQALKAAKARGAKLIGIVNTPQSSISRIVDLCIRTKAGKEIAVASTKAFIAQSAMLSLLSFACAGRIEEGTAEIEKLAKGISQVLSASSLGRLKAISFLSQSKDIFTIGRGLNYPIAIEAALKIKEISYIHAEGLAGGELKHGSLALVENGTPCIAFIGSERQDIISNALEVKARGGLLIGIGHGKDDAFGHWIEVPDIGLLTPLLSIVPAQILAYNLAVEKSLDPDKPRNLAKAVTVK